MNCKTYQKQIEAFDKKELLLREEDSFIKHISTCNDCKEELEIYYIIKYGLDDETEEAGNLKEVNPAYAQLIRTYDFKALVDKILYDSANNIAIQKRINSRNITIFAINEGVLLAAAAFLLFSLI